MHHRRYVGVRVTFFSILMRRESFSLQWFSITSIASRARSEKLWFYKRKVYCFFRPGCGRRKRCLARTLLL